MMTGNGSTLFLSDLHLFAKRSIASRLQQDIESRCRQARHVILGGDIFDFRWSTLPSHEATIAAAIEWLDKLVRLRDDLRVTLLLGNHDCEPQFVNHLTKWSNNEERFEFHPHYLRIGTSLFLHGDVADKPITHEQLEFRRKKKKHDPLPRFRHSLYDAVVGLKLHRVPEFTVHRPSFVAKRIHHYLRSLAPPISHGLKRIYFGHTHVPMHGFEFGGIRFYNGGSAIRGLKFHILEVEGTEDVKSA